MRNGGGIHHPILHLTNGQNERPSESDEPNYHFLVLIELKKKTASSEKRVNKKSSRKPHLKINARIHRAPLARSLVCQDNTEKTKVTLTLDGTIDKRESLTLVGIVRMLILFRFQRLKLNRKLRPLAFCAQPKMHRPRSILLVT